MKLYYSPTSPYVRKVMVVLHETGQLDDVELLSAATTPVAPDAALKAKNPLGKVPALERADGPAMFDSRVITAYLDQRGKGGLYPEGARHWDTRTLEALGDGMLDAAILMTYESRLRSEQQRWDGWVDAQWDKIAHACDTLEAIWMSHLAGPLDIGQIAVACALSYADFRHGPRNWRAGHDALAAWFAEFESRPSMVATRPPAAA
ncbi:glutathione S-transferase [Pseudooceanicola lipolyticus]|uniref:Glutathione S-transferase n=1 Tax=Pseudooceanicola lipolyticus TaxID=2029104 RepID=A0A2M8IV29_9RHOB|nr:glutathione S-transferase [Pseudooceanicola lipolyticus]PJE34384.1 glutathione S-transferase [Pseudooceanicola lipolyticus]